MTADSISSREIRVFISSTFRDMQPERNHLVSKVFPRLREMAMERSVSFIAVDLRWGVTYEEAHSGKVIEICLNEIEESQPFFIGILGNRYGWVPDPAELSSNPTLSEKWGGWLKDDINKGLSLTEIEMQYGVLRNDADLNAFFFIREDSDAEEPQQQARLKEAVRANGRYPVAGYSSPEELGALVEKSFCRLLDKLYPAEESFKEFELRRSTFIRSKLLYYLPMAEADNVFDVFIKNRDVNLLIVDDEPGGGKSSFLAHSFLRVDEDYLPCKAAAHFIGDGYSGGDYRKVVEALISEICGLYDIKDDSTFYSNPDTALWRLFALLPSDRPLTVILDGLDQLANDGKSLAWLPWDDKYPVHYLVSTVPGDDTWHVLKQRGGKNVKLGFRTDQQKEEIIYSYLEIFGKTLPQSLVDAIVAWPLSDNNFMLRSLLDELVRFGLHEELENFIKAYLACDNPAAYFSRLLSGYISDFAAAGKVLPLLAYSKAGLSEDEIISIAGVSRMSWSEFRAAFKPYFATVADKVTISNNLMHKAISDFFKSEEKSCRKILCSAFTGTENRRAYSECAYQLHVLKKHKDLRGLLLRPEVFDALYKTNPYELGKYWKPLKKHLKRYLSVRHASNDDRIRFRLDVADFCSGILDEVRLSRWFVKQANKAYITEPTNDKQLRLRLYEYRAQALTVSGLTTKVYPYLYKALQIKRELYPIDSAEIADIYYLIGSSMSVEAYDDKDTAIRYFNKSLEIRQKLYGEYHLSVSEVYTGLANLYPEDSDSHHDFHAKALEIRRRLLGENHPALAENYIGMGHSDKHEAYIGKAVEIYRSNFGRFDRRTIMASFDYWLQRNFTAFYLTPIAALLLLFPTLWIAKSFYTAAFSLIFLVCMYFLTHAIGVTLFKERNYTMTAISIAVWSTPVWLFYIIPRLVHHFDAYWLEALITVVTATLSVGAIFLATVFSDSADKDIFDDQDEYEAEKRLRENI